MADPELGWKVRRARREGDVETLVAALQDETEASMAADFLGEMGASSAIPALIPLMEAANPYQRASAVLSLEKLNAVNTCPWIMQIAEQDDVPWVRACATQALSGLPCDAQELLVRALDDSDIRVRRVAVEALMKAGKSNAVSALVAARKREHWFSRRIYSKAIRRLKRRS